MQGASGQAACILIQPHSQQRDKRKRWMRRRKGLVLGSLLRMQPRVLLKRKDSALLR